MRDRAARVRGLIDQMADGHGDALAVLVKFNQYEIQAQNLKARGNYKLADARSKWADNLLTRAAKILVAQAARLEYIANEMEQLRDSG